MGGFHHKVACRLTGRRGRDGGWVYPLLNEAISEAGLQEVETYFYRRQNTVAQFIVARPIVDLCLVAERRLR